MVNRGRPWSAAFYHWALDFDVGFAILDPDRPWFSVVDPDRHGSPWPTTLDHSLHAVDDGLTSHVVDYGPSLAADHGRLWSTTYLLTYDR
jgi:hypothetical protein